MVKRRVIPVVLMRNGAAVQSKGFSRYQRLGDPVTIVQRLSDWAADELIYLDISRAGGYDLGRDDLNADAGGGPLDILERIARRCFMPLAFGGGIRTLGDCADRMSRGADKVVITTQAAAAPEFIDACARSFGTQCVVVGIDVRTTALGWEVFIDGGRRACGRTAVEWAREAQDRGAGELLVQALERDGRGCGYDLELVAAVSRAVSVPVIALGGAGTAAHLAEGLHRGGAAAVAAANMFNYTENSVYAAKSALYDSGVDVREPLLGYAV